MMNQEGGRPCSRASVNTRFGTAAFLCSATLGVVLATGSVFAAVPPALQFIRHDIDQGAFGQITEGINVGDIAGDGRPDIVVGGDNYLVWFHNPDWAPHLIASGFKFAGGAMVVVRDMDGDGRLDVMTGSTRWGTRSCGRRSGSAIRRAGGPSTSSRARASATTSPSVTSTATATSTPYVTISSRIRSSGCTARPRRRRNGRPP